MQFGDVLYDIRNYEVIEIMYVCKLTESYSVCINVSEDKPLSVYTERLKSMYITKLDALIALQDIVQSHLDNIKQEIQQVVS